MCNFSLQYGITDRQAVLPLVKIHAADSNFLTNAMSSRRVTAGVAYIDVKRFVCIYPHHLQDVRIHTATRDCMSCSSLSFTACAQSMARTSYSDTSSE